MSLFSIGLAQAPPRTSGGFQVSTSVLVIIIVIAVLGVLAVIGWRAPDRSPGAETKAQRDRAED